MPVDDGEVKYGCPVEAVLAVGVTEQLLGVEAMAVAKVIAIDVAEEIVHDPARIEIPAGQLAPCCTPEESIQPTQPPDGALVRGCTGTVDASGIVKLWLAVKDGAMIWTWFPAPLPTPAGKR